MDELDQIRKKKADQIRRNQFEQLQQHSQEQDQLQQQIQQLENAVKQAFTKEALERYGNLKIAYPDRAVQLLVILSQAIQSGQINIVDDKMLKEILKKINPEKKEINIKRV
jgi:DNA-binding TFAR19-related protein (PDSD5 family)